MTSRLEARMTPSLLERLTDDQPANSRDPYVSAWEEQRLIRDGIRRDLAVLLNCRRNDSDVPAAFELTRACVLMFGIPDYTAFNLKDTNDQETLRASIERAVRLFEPRLARVAVTFETTEQPEPAIHFHLEAAIVGTHHCF